MSLKEKNARVNEDQSKAKAGGMGSQEEKGESNRNKVKPSLTKQ